MPGSLPPEVPAGVITGDVEDGPSDHPFGSPTSDQNRNGGISQGGGGHPGIDGHGSLSWEGHHSGIVLGNPPFRVGDQAMHSSGHKDAGVMPGLPGPDGNISYDGSEVRQGY